jgi:hypothetical protein
LVAVEALEAVATLVAEVREAVGDTDSTD